MDDRLNASVILCAYTQERWDELTAAVHSLQSQTVPPHEIILVIDHNQELFERAQESFQTITITENRESPGLSGARNCGVALATGNVIAFIDEDAVAQPDWLECLLEMYTDPHVMGVGGEIRPDWIGGRPDWFPEEFNWVVGCSYLGLPVSSAPVRNLIGCNMSFRQNVFTESGGFRSNMGRIGTVPVGCEETEFCIRARQHIPNLSFLYQPAALVYHKVPGKRARWGYFLHRCYAEGLSKAQVTQFVGANDGLASERQYVRKTLPAGVRKGLADGLLHGRTAGLGRALAITLGLCATVTGYWMGKMFKSTVKRQQHITPSTSNFVPVKVVEVELSEPIPELTPLTQNPGTNYRRALVLVRLHACPLGSFELDLDENLTKDVLSAQLWDKFHEAINWHLIQEGFPLADGIPVEGLTPEYEPGCLAGQQAIMDNPPLVSVVIATRDRAESLAATLDTLLKQVYPTFEVILVDNAPKTSETLDVFNLYRPKFLEKEIELGYVREDLPGLSVAHNRGLVEARGEIAAFTDDDVLVDKYWLLELVRGFSADNHVGCVTGLIIPAELDTPAQAMFEQFGGFTKGFDRHIYDLHKNRPAEPLFPYTAGRFGSGANMGFRIEALKSIGGFDPALGVGTPTLGADDLAAFYQTIDKGYQLVYQPTALAFHKHRRTYEGLVKQMRGYGMGLTAFVTKCMLDRPGRVFDIASRLPAGLNYAFNPGSAKNRHKPKDYPKELERVEQKGMLFGPFAYLYSRYRYRKAQAIV